ncbi:hypothetical protein CAPTEDRAFT_191720 [Capitella teleta]|uniref:Uncharacterized protein n=1 Tax=Capitella teleta TaxID=283909 RepID=R7U086_CAPTE|nr:hypothetical protein CAPTEDRAFT_191720 [Capitella teleta]|eukprot:ELT97076.1 hypothetical protein CAPTEDRAFT_191720 [Capitella teleta]
MSLSTAFRLSCKWMLDFCKHTSMKRPNKPLRLKDIHNIKAKQFKDITDWEATLKNFDYIRQRDPGATIDVFARDSDSTLEMIILQTTEMKKALAEFPEIEQLDMNGSEEFLPFLQQPLGPQSMQPQMIEEEVLQSDFISANEILGDSMTWTTLESAEPQFHLVNSAQVMQKADNDDYQLLMIGPSLPSPTNSEAQEEAASAPECKDKKLTWKRQSNPEEWKTNKRKELRQSGAAYRLVKGKETTKRNLEERQRTRKKYSFKYHFFLEDEEIRVCKEFYLSTHNISQRRISYFHEQKKDPTSGINVTGDKRGILRIERIPKAKKDESSEVSIGMAMKQTNAVLFFLSAKYCDEMFDVFYDNTLKNSNGVTNEPSLPRQRRPPKRLVNGVAPHVFASPKEMCRQQNFQVVDSMIADSKRRFNRGSLAVPTSLEAFLLEAANGKNE